MIFIKKKFKNNFILAYWQWCERICMESMENLKVACDQSKLISKEHFFAKIEFKKIRKTIKD